MKLFIVGLVLALLIPPAVRADDYQVCTEYAQQALPQEDEGPSLLADHDATAALDDFSKFAQIRADCSDHTTGQVHLWNMLWASGDLYGAAMSQYALGNKAKAYELFGISKNMLTYVINNSTGKLHARAVAMLKSSVLK